MSSDTLFFLLLLFSLQSALGILYLLAALAISRRRSSGSVKCFGKAKRTKRREKGFANELVFELTFVRNV